MAANVIDRVQLMSRADGLTRLFKEIKEKDTIDDLSIEYKKFAEWLRIEEGPHRILESILPIIPQSRCDHLSSFPC